jgi:hypothetical protein
MVHYCVSTVELNLELKPQANNIRISPNLTYYVSPRVVFLRRKLNDPSNFN